MDRGGRGQGDGSGSPAGQDGARVGVVITGPDLGGTFLQDEPHTLVHLGQAHRAHVDVTPTFAALRQHAAFEAREWLAYEMYDGLAQKLVTLGYRINSSATMLRPPLRSSPWHSTGFVWIWAE